MLLPCACQSELSDITYNTRAIQIYILSFLEVKQKWNTLKKQLQL